MDIEWNRSFPAVGPGITGDVYDVDPGTVVTVSMTIIVPPELEGAFFEWWQQYGDDEYSTALEVGENNLNFQVAIGSSGDWGLIRALVFHGGGTTGVVVEIPTEPVVTVPGEPIANDDESETTEGRAVVTDVLANDTIDGEPVTLEDVTLPTIVRHPEFGTAEVLPNGSIRYTPEPGFVGEDSYEYEIQPVGDGCLRMSEFYHGDSEVSGYMFSVEGGLPDLSSTGGSWRLLPEEGEDWLIYLSYYTTELFIAENYYGDVPYGDSNIPALLQMWDDEAEPTHEFCVRMNINGRQ